MKPQNNTIYLTESHVIDQTHPLFKDIDRMAYLSKNLYNHVLYVFRRIDNINKHRKEKGLKLLRYPKWQKVVKKLTKIEQRDFKAIPAKIAQQTVIWICTDWDNYQKALRAYFKDRTKFKASRIVTGKQIGRAHV